MGSEVWRWMGQGRVLVDAALSIDGRQPAPTKDTARALKVGVTFWAAAGIDLAEE